jgi:hypothetical protein
MRSAVLLICALLAGCAGTPGPAPLRLNDIQALASHNSYKRAIEPPLLEALLERAGPRMLGLDYAHPPLAEQLDAGLLKLELDVFHDPAGGRYAAPGGLELVRGLGAEPAPFDVDALRAPGFKVLHVQDIDFRSQCATLQRCLAELRAWSDAHPGHLPVAISINAKQTPLRGMAGTTPLPFDAAAWDALDAELRAGLGDRLLEPDEVRGASPTLRRAVRRRGWPLLDAVRGRFLVVLDERMDVLEGYLDGHPVLDGRSMFAIVPEDHPAAAFLILNDPVAEAERIRAAVRAGYLVRTRADADTREARSGDVSRRDAAFASGAHFVSTDYYRPDPRFRTGYRVALPGGVTVRCNPVRRPEAICAVPIEAVRAPAP